jgi:hypothetical protein
MSIASVLSKEIDRLMIAHWKRGKLDIASVLQRHRITCSADSCSTFYYETSSEDVCWIVSLG